MQISKAVQDNPARAEKILKGARLVFVESGFDGASVDDIAAQAGVSKATLYRYFPDKQRMFQAYIAAECEQQANQTFTLDADAKNIEDALRAIARQFVTFLLSDSAIEMFRVAFSEVRRFPDLGRDFYESGPGNAHKLLSRLLSEAAGRGELVVPDSDFAAEQFTELCKADLYMKRLLGVKNDATPSEIAKVANEAVRVFLCAYGST